MHILQRAGHTGLLAHIGDVLHNAVPRHHEASDPAHDQAPIRAVHVRQSALSR